MNPFKIATRMGGTCMALFDVCRTPSPTGAPIPVPYVNKASMMQANPATCSKKVRTMNQPWITKMTMVMMSFGNEMGTMGCVISQLIKGLVKFNSGHARVKTEGQPTVVFMTPTAHNGMNANVPMGIHDTSSQPKVGTPTPM